MSAELHYFVPALDPDDGAEPTPGALGSKGFGLAVMVRLGLPVPPGFTLDTTFTGRVRAAGGRLDDAARARIAEALEQLARIPGGPRRVSVRAAPVRSMPGMLDTVLDLTDSEVPEAVERVLASWERDRARRWREDYAIPDDETPAVVVQRMVYGDRGAASGTGVAYSRDPRTGEARITGEFLQVARGPELVGGRRGGISLAVDHLDPAAQSFETLYPRLFELLAAHVDRLERHFGEVPNIEFTVEEGVLWFLQTRPATLTLRAAARVTHELLRQGALNPEQALQRIDPWTLLQRLQQRTDPDEALAAEAAGRLLATGLAASPGHATGALVFDPDEAVLRAERGEAVVLVRRESVVEDVAGIRASAGVLTTAGGLTSHAAVVARSLGRCCITGCAALEIDLARGELRSRVDPSRAAPLGSIVTLDGVKGRVFLGALRSRTMLNDPALVELLKIADARRRTKVLALASRPADVIAAGEVGADGVLFILERADPAALAALLSPQDPPLEAPSVLLPRGVTRAELLSLRAHHAFTAVIPWPDLPGDARLDADALLYDRGPGAVECAIRCGVRIGSVRPVESLQAARDLGLDFVACPTELVPTARWTLARVSSSA